LMVEEKYKMPDFASRKFGFGYLTALNILDTMGVDLSQVDIKAVGIYQNYSGEVRSQEPQPGTPITKDTHIALEVGRESAVDYMPYQFFYGLTGIRDTDRTWEDNSRALMAPFDASVIRHRAGVRFSTLQYEFGIIDDRHVERFLGLFEFDLGGGWKDKDDILLWVSVLPSLYLWGGNPEIVAGVFNNLFKYEFRLKENVNSSTQIPEDLQYKLGEKVARLGKETVVGSSFQEWDSTYELVVCNINPDELPLFLPGGEIRKRMEKILDYCMPGDLDYRIAVEVGRGKVEMGNNTYLGYSSFV
jgi:hypothetical protein